VLSITYGRLDQIKGACFTDPEILWESMWSPPLYQDSNRTVEGQTMEYMWTAGGLNRESSPKSKFKVHVQSTSSPPQVQSFIGNPTGGFPNNPVHQVDSMWTPSGVQQESNRIAYLIIENKKCPSQGLNPVINKDYIINSQN
jgi:hypothetical protein